MSSKLRSHHFLGHASISLVTGNSKHIVKAGTDHNFHSSFPFSTGYQLA